ncbi:hypothetical protein [Lentzea kentuckyensis]|uniref:hypothetical protein n=1 Tax=Lentzea kentuckyensis TaxID=360086 RepID=UPI000A3A02B7|nr:hypothetical protein [Lentzea kentuckyensis]
MNGNSTQTAAMRANSTVVLVDHVSRHRALVHGQGFHAIVDRAGSNFTVRVDEGTEVLADVPSGPDGFVRAAQTVAEAQGLAPGAFTLEVNRVQFGHSDSQSPVLRESRTFAVAASVCEYVKRSEPGRPGVVGYMSVWSHIANSDQKQHVDGHVFITVDRIGAEWFWRLARDVFESSGDVEAEDLARCVGEAFPESDPSGWL